jgi:hypothetical protein
VPVAGQSRVSIGREFWQVLAIDNLIDHRQPLCQKSNRSRHDGGVITVYAQSSDSVVEGNRQYDTDGIFLHQGYVVPEHPCPTCAMEGFFQSFLEIRSNTVDGKYDWTTDCGSSGIVADLFASPWNHEIPPTVSFGLDISHNKIRHADGPRGGAIALYNSWYSGPDPQVWPLGDNILIQHNSIEDIDGTRAMPVCGSGHPRVGITFPQTAVAWRTVFYANACLRVSQRIGGSGIDTKRICPSSVAPSCECGD